MIKVNSEDKNKTVKQIVLYLIICFFAGLVQVAILAVLYFSMKNYKEPLPLFLDNIFNEKVMGEGHNNWGYVLPFLISNIVANILAYFTNKKRTFNSDAPLWYFVLYFFVIVVLLITLTWLQGVIVNALENVIESLALIISSIAIGIIMGLVLFPLQKFVFSRERKSKD